MWENDIDKWPFIDIINVGIYSDSENQLIIPVFRGFYTHLPMNQYLSLNILCKKTFTLELSAIYAI